nr:hypothetical protein 4 [bacterium]
MFKEPTVFILGAGASVNYGFPLGDALVDNIVKGISQGVGLYKTTTEENHLPCFGGHSYYEMSKILFQNRNLLSNSQCDKISNFAEDFFNPDKHLDFAENLRRWEGSIDRFLKVREEFKDLGKWYIALEILSCFFNSHVNREGMSQANITHPRAKKITINNHLYTRNNKSGNWYGLLLDKITFGCDALEDIYQNKLTVITFNYDTSLEYYLEKELQSFPQFQGIELSKVIDIHHVYGNIELNTKHENFKDVAFGNIHRIHKDDQKLASKISNEIFLESFFQSIDKIHTIGEKQVSATAQNAQDAIRKAKNVFILGFGFIPENLKLLNLQKTIITSRLQSNTFSTNYKNTPKIEDLLSSPRAPSAMKIPKENISHNDVYTALAREFYAFDYC